MEWNPENNTIAQKHAFIADSQGIRPLRNALAVVNPSEVRQPYFCTYTQGFYGEPGGKTCSGHSAADIMTSVMDGNDALFGLPAPDGYNFLLKFADVADGNIFKMLPGGGPSAVFKGSATYQDKSSHPNVPIRKDKIRNTLLAQTMALYFNMGWNSGTNPAISDGGFDLSLFELQGDVLYTAKLQNCSDVVIQGSEEAHYLKPNVLQALNDLYNNSSESSNSLCQGSKVNVESLLDLANRLLGGDETLDPSYTAKSFMEDVSSTITALNEGFDECRMFVRWENLSPGDDESKTVSDSKTKTETEALVNDGIDLNEDLEFRAEIVPNPFEYHTEIWFKLSYDSKVKIEIYDLLGNLIQETYEGMTKADEQQVVRCSIPAIARGRYLICLIHTSQGIIVKKMLSESF